MTHRHEEHGTASIELIWVGLLLLVPLVWIVVSVFEVQRGSFGVTAAARAAGRAYALAPDDATGRHRAEEVARQALADQGVDDAQLRIRITCTPYPHDCHAGTSVVTVRVESSVVLPLLPDALGGGQPRFSLDATHTVPVGRYREIEAAR